MHTYAQVSLGFTVPDDEAQRRAIDKLVEAANKLVSIFPWLAGQVVNEGSGPSNSGTFKVVAYPEHQGPFKFIRVKDCANELPPYTDILTAGAPLSMIDGRILSPAYSFPCVYPVGEIMPVVILQINTLSGGMFMTFCGQHNVLDGNSTASFIQYLARVCAGKELTADEIAVGNIDRDRAFPQAVEKLDLDELQYLRMPSLLSQPRPTWPPEYGPAPWYLFRIPSSKITQLKAAASTPAMNGHSEGIDTAPFFSTNDLLTAFLWKHLVRSRCLDKDIDPETALIRAVNGRKRFSPPIPAEYLGHTIQCVYTRIPLASLSILPLGTIASALRRKLIDGTTPASLSKLVHLFRTEDDKTTINYGATMNGKTDVVITSHIAHEVATADFGAGIGMPDVVRRCNLPDGRATAYMMPRARDGSVEVATSLTKEDVHILRNGPGCEEFNETVEWVG
ncbi:hypothetical protein EJ04DRAFT_502679 [Polyplosphaeria fusca]|uniref:Trichothecene 3-O-acetyltransferase-like N-terminal domain-containing protein n=1 Tax=Polyplosphaeria fusca TaxID=682080 RepID=A0A9P4UWF4_9PLEO|nr:hypothetical protein EJ04DRAFT_502679 [Polyplosphaeria fusca]